MAAFLKSIVDKLVALYVRLSRDDENEGDSNSIAHQIEILTKYCKDHGITNYKIYKDDGYSGTSFNRPGFQEMLADIETGLVGTVIVKDMSRFGRNYLEVGLYTEIRFPEMGVHFIAVNDGVDSENQMDNDFAPFRNIINEWYAKDTSKKIRAVFRAKAMAGERVTGAVPYGYREDENGNLVIDEETAPIVKRIFQLCVEGNGPGKIARILTEENIPNPGTMLFRRTGCTRNYRPDSPCFWQQQTIQQMLERDTYLGQTTNFKYSKLSYKSKKVVINPPEKRITFENTHEAIIDRDTWDIVQRAREQRRRPTKAKEVALFSGMVYCADCGARLYVSRTNRENATKEWYNCAHYRSRQGCTPHHITGNALRILVLQNLQRVIAYAEVDEADFVKRVIENKASLRREERNAARRKLEKAERRIGELDTIIQKLYEDNVIGKLTDERFAKMSAAYEKEQRELQESASALRSILEEADAVSVNIESFLDMVKKYTDPTELTPALLHELVEKIVVHEGDKSSGHRVQQIDVYYNFIGEIYLSPESARTGSLQVR